MHATQNADTTVRRTPEPATGDVRSLGEQPHDPTRCIDQGRPHPGPCLDPQTADTAEFVLRSAATYLDRYGWIQGAYYDATSQGFTPAACMVGAIGMVCYGGPVDAPAQMFDDPGYLDFEEAVLHLDRFLLVEDGSESYEFNDAKGRRVVDVCRVLRQAADTPAEDLIDALHAANLCTRCYYGCCGTGDNGSADPGAFDRCGCRCHRTTAHGGDA